MEIRLPVPIFQNKVIIWIKISWINARLRVYKRQSEYLMSSWKFFMLKSRYDIICLRNLNLRRNIVTALHRVCYRNIPTSWINWIWLYNFNEQSITSILFLVTPRVELQLFTNSELTPSEGHRWNFSNFPPLSALYYRRERHNTNSSALLAVKFFFPTAFHRFRICNS